MTLVIILWTLAMVSGLLWARHYTVFLTAATLVAYLWAHPVPLTGWVGWLRAAVLGLTPWLLAAQRGRIQGALKALQAEEAKRSSHLADTARGLSSVQQATQQIESQITQITDLYHVTKDTSGALHLKELFAASLNIAPRLLDAQGLRLIDLSGETPQVLRASRAADGRLVEAVQEGGTSGAEAGRPLEMEEAVVKRAVESRQPASVPARQLSKNVPEGVSRVAWSLLWGEQKPVGVLVADELPDEQLKTFAIVANQLSLQASRIRLYQQVEALAVTDALTGLFVRGYFLERARDELARTARHRLSCSLLMADLDHFKQKNDTHGHLVGDVVLKEVAHLLQRHLREIDLIARFGGEEFILLLIETQVDQAMVIAQRLRQLVEAHSIRAYDEVLTQTISIGLAGFPEHGDTLETLIERADQALYAAKRGGRNQVVQWTSDVR